MSEKLTLKVRAETSQATAKLKQLSSVTKKSS